MRTLKILNYRCSVCSFLCDIIIITFYCYLYIATIERARKLADEAKYKSDLSMTEDELNYKASKIPNSPSSVSSMPLFSGSGMLKIDLDNFLKYLHIFMNFPN